MKKYFLILLVTTISFGQASNQMVTFTQAQSLGFSLKSGQSNVTSNQCMTKSDALAKYNLDANAMASYASNQLVPKSVWINGVVGVPFAYNTTVYNNSIEVCNTNAPTSIFHYTISGLNVGARIYSDQSCTTEVNSPTGFWRIANENGVKIAYKLKGDKTVEFVVICPQ